MDLVIASSNLTKLRELKRILVGIVPQGVRLCSLLDTPAYVPPNEVGACFEDFAIQKAVQAASSLRLPCVADASGLVVPALGGYTESLRRKKLQAPSAKLPNTKQLLEDLSHYPDEVSRSAFLECAVAFADPETGLIQCASSRMEGFIASKEAGPSTFDFISVFVKNDYRKTLAEIPQAALEAISHRKKACDKLAATIKDYFRRKAT